MQVRAGHCSCTSILNRNCNRHSALSSSRTRSSNSIHSSNSTVPRNHDHSSGSIHSRTRISTAHMIEAGTEIPETGPDTTVEVEAGAEDAAIAQAGGAAVAEAQIDSSIGMHIATGLAVTAGIGTTIGSIGTAADHETGISLTTVGQAVAADHVSNVGTGTTGTVGEAEATVGPDRKVATPLGTAGTAEAARGRGSIEDAAGQTAWNPRLCMMLVWDISSNSKLATITRSNGLKLQSCPHRYRLGRQFCLECRG